MKKQGTQIHKSSLIKTIIPLRPINAWILNGDTSMGVQGKKYLLLLKGDNIAIPWPPLVKASSRPWLAVSKKK